MASAASLSELGRSAVMEGKVKVESMVRGVSRRRRDQVLTRDGRKCANCGTMTILWEEYSTHFTPDLSHPGILVLTDQSYAREYTRRRFTLDHIIPRCRGGKNGIANLQVLCAPCNSAKGIRA